MCGIVGYVGFRNAAGVLLDGMKRLEYRGYDSAGIAVNNGSEVQILKEIGKVQQLEDMVSARHVEGHLGIGHTRWATHGGVSVINAHPHRDERGQVVLVHNGIIENYKELREELFGQGVEFITETDTEVVAKLISQIYSVKGDMIASLVSIYERLRGSFALAILLKNDSDTLYCVRKGSPLVVGRGKGEAFCASDVPALLPYTQDVFYMNDGDIARLTPKGINFWSDKGVSLEKSSQRVDWDLSMVDKGGYPHFMLKEINEQGAVLRSTMGDRIKGEAVDFSKELGWSQESFAKIKKIHIVACGTSYYASLVAERLMEGMLPIDIRVEIASEYRQRSIHLGEDVLAIFVSQSGETADTIAAERLAKSKGALCLAITNGLGSSLAREVDHVLLLKAGPEIGVAATKTFTGQLAVLYLLGIYMAKLSGALSSEEEGRLVKGLLKLPYQIEEILERQEMLKPIAEKYASSRDFLYLGRGRSFPLAHEGALKLKEISYIHAEAFAAGELKHGPIAMLESDIPVVIIAPQDSLYEKLFSNVVEVRARKSPVIAIATQGDSNMKDVANDVFYIPSTDHELYPFLAVVPLQIFAYYIARARGCDIDRPRNLAKSVTVE